MSEQQIFSKCAWRLIPFMLVLYLVNILDRVNVGFAALTMNEDLGFSPTVYGFGAGVFFLGYCLFQIPANAMLRRIGPRRWIFIITALWGLISTANSLIRDPETFYALRFLLGVAEAGFFPGMLLYLTYWFPQAYRARHIGNFMVALPLANLIGGPLSSLILQLDGAAGLHGWQWLFLAEGVPTCLLSLAVISLLPDAPRSASWLTDEEKNFIVSRLAADDNLEVRDFWQPLRDVRVYVIGLVMFGFQLGNQVSLLWLPQIVQSMGFSTLANGFLISGIYLFGATALVTWAQSSDRKRERIWHAALPLLVGATGFVGASATEVNLVALLALTLIVIGINATFAPLFSLPSMFLSGAAAASGIALANMIGNLGGFLGPYLVGVLRDQTNDYAIGMRVVGFALIVAAVTVLAAGRTFSVSKTKLA